ncbi:HelD family protein [Raoultibacter phocaeensis]|uniref:HelD family protein n=1 Tax=Raoultibacter phocaeensis TaxID=2479841 RepID=UPI0021057849|nr:UvrD-helicase domain-containing protein [Raoultibacter phocaeensis]
MPVRCKQTPDTAQTETDEHGSAACSDDDSLQDSKAVFREEQQHLSATYKTLEEMKCALGAKIAATDEAAADDKRSMADDLSVNLSSYADAMETYADFATVNRVIDGYNIAHDLHAEKLARIEVLLRQPYFAKVSLQFKQGEKAKDLYIGSAGVSDESYRRLVVDWRSPVAEVYYNQDMGPTTYRANGRTIDVDLKLRRQFDIEGNVLNAYFDTSVAIQDALLLASLSKERSAHMQAITATIQKEQNQVIRHDDVPVLLVSGIAGSGKTSVLLQRIAYLFYRRRDDLDPSEVFLITPNPVFRHYIDNVLPDLGERNPETFTWDEFIGELMPPDRAHGEADVSVSTLERIDALAGTFSFEQNDFKELRFDSVRLIPAGQIAQIAAKFKHLPAGPHLVSLMREELEKRLASRIAQMAGTDAVHDEVLALAAEEQVRIFHETIDPEDDEELRAASLAYLNDRFAAAFAAVENDDWLRIDRIGMRLLGVSHLEPVTWLYLKIALTGLGNPYAKYVMIDEVQDYTAAQLMVLGRYFRRAHFMLLGDQNQAIKPHTATFDEARRTFETLHGEVSECRLMTSYRSSPEVTALFASLLEEGERMHVSSIQRAGTPLVIAECSDKSAYEEKLRCAVRTAARNEGLTAIIVPWKSAAKHVQMLIGEDAPALVKKNAALPDSGTIVIPLELAKGLEFDHVIVPDASERVFPDDELSRRRLYTTISRATKSITLIAQGSLTPLLKTQRAE